MLLSGFTLIRNGIKYDFPFIESLKSLIAVCDEVVVNVGKSEDATREAIVALGSSKVRIVDTVWPLDDPEKRKGGKILAEQTNVALEHCKGKWALYLQGDEVLHEQDYDLIRKQIELVDTNPRVDAIVFQYVHFYGSYDVVQTSRASYRREIRAVRNTSDVRSTGDAQSFRNADGSKLKAVLSTARIFHYGWVRPQELMRVKTAFMDTLYHPKATTEKPETGNNCEYKRIVGLKRFEGSHPAVMQKRVQNAPRFDFSQAPRVFQLNDVWKVVSGAIEKFTGVRPFEYKNYKIVKLSNKK